MHPSSSTLLPLGHPPTVAALGIGVHGGDRSTEEYLLSGLVSLHLYDYHGTVRVDGVEHEIRPGHLSLIPAGSLMEFRYHGVSRHLFAHLRPHGTQEQVRFPVMQDLGLRAARTRSRLEVAARVRHSRHRDAEIWSILWELASSNPSSPSPEAPLHPAVQSALSQLDARLPDQISPSELADVSSVSPSHLRRLFHEAFGCSVSTYIRRRRAEHARHLLTETTRSIASIAAGVGIPDLQHFNKLCRTMLGASPSRIRQDSERSGPRERSGDEVSPLTTPPTRIPDSADRP